MAQQVTVNRDCQPTVDFHLSEDKDNHLHTTGVTSNEHDDLPVVVKKEKYEGQWAKKKKKT